ncbi:MAG: RNA polymerase sigma factor [Armatimonadetes bacterium]|nr:RNA polymerase sigma factor [Armatimonadota bacterium]
MAATATYPSNVQHGTSDRDDDVLVEQIRAGDHAAFATLFQKYKTGLYRFCLLMLGESQAAEDIYQDIFLNFYSTCRQGQPIRNVRYYLFGAARNRCLRHLQIARRMEPLPDFETLEYAASDEAQQADIKLQLEEALQRINPVYREAFLLFELEDYSYEEIAAQLEVTREVVRNRIYRAKQALQKILRKSLGE